MRGVKCCDLIVYDKESGMQKRAEKSSRIHKRALYLLMFFFILPLASGCFTLNMNHNRRHIEVVRQDLHELHQDIDLILFGMEPLPSE